MPLTTKLLKFQLKFQSYTLKKTNRERLTSSTDTIMKFKET